MNTITYLGYTNSPPTISFAASGKRYTYDLPSPKALDTILFLIRTVTAARGFVFAKRIGRLANGL